MVSSVKYIFLDGLLPALGAQQQQAGMPWWLWFLLIVLVIFLFVLVWAWVGLSKGAEAPIFPDSKPVADVPAPQSEKSTLIVEKTNVDDLTLIEGIGPKIAGVLQDHGITTFTQLASTDLTTLEAALQTAGLRLADPESWAEQAKLAADGKMDELKALQDNLKGGRRA
jgi:predicted flap endonuclease-1-like 5' DNA nuclease